MRFSILEAIEKKKFPDHLIRICFGLITGLIALIGMIYGVSSGSDHLADSILQISVCLMVLLGATRLVFKSMNLRAGMDPHSEQCGDLAPHHEPGVAPFNVGIPLYTKEGLQKILLEGTHPDEADGFTDSEIWASKFFTGLGTAPRRLRILVEGVFLAATGTIVVFAFLVLACIFGIAAGVELDGFWWRVALWMALLGLLGQWRSGIPESPLARWFKDLRLLRPRDLVKATLLAIVLPFLVGLLIDLMPPEMHPPSLGWPILALVTTSVLILITVLCTYLLWSERLDRFGESTGDEALPAANQGFKIHNRADPGRLSMAVFNAAKRFEYREKPFRFYSVEGLYIGERNVRRLGENAQARAGLIVTILAHTLLLFAAGFFILSAPEVAESLKLVISIPVDSSDPSDGLSRTGKLVLSVGYETVNWLLFPSILALFAQRLDWLAIAFTSERRYRSLLFLVWGSIHQDPEYIERTRTGEEEEEEDEKKEKDEKKSRTTWKAERFGALLARCSEIESVVFPRPKSKSIEWPRQIVGFVAQDKALLDYLVEIRKELEAELETRPR